tara:strand:- start:6173 stop:6748 length:576 start_codon:yes stop_codon:yes gene_type:complete
MKILFSLLIIFFSLFEIKPINAKEEIFLGNKDSKITVIEYASMTCVHCANFHIYVYPKIKKEYIDTNKIKFIFRDFPLDKQALYGSMLAKCAPKEKYFDYVELVLTKQKKWISNNDEFIKKLINIGKLAGLNEEKIESCFKNEKLVDEIIKIRTTAEKKYNINSTPSFIINGKKYSSLDYESFKKIIDDLI